MLGVGHKVEVSGIVIGDAKGLFKGLAGIEREPDVRDCGVDECQNTTAWKKILCAALIGKLNRLEAHNKIAGDVGSEVEGDVVRSKTRLVIATESQGRINLL